MINLTKRLAVLAAVWVSVWAGLAAAPGMAQASDLVGLLTSQLGVSEPQAAGGAGSLFNFAKGQMGSGDFDLVSAALPEIGGLMDAAPSGSSDLLGSGSSLLGGSSLGGSSDGLGEAAGVAGSFSELGLSPDMVNEFVPVILDYAESEGGQQVMQWLQGAFTAL